MKEKEKKEGTAGEMQGRSKGGEACESRTCLPVAVSCSATPASSVAARMLHSLLVAAVVRRQLTNFSGCVGGDCCCYQPHTHTHLLSRVKAIVTPHAISAD